MAYIYKITNIINQKVYIGKTEQINPDNRWKEHMHDYTRRRNEKRPLYSAMKKYGVENFSFEILEETDIPEEREVYYINKYRSYVGFKDCNGYNATLGGDGKKYLNLDEDEVIRYHIEEAYRSLNKTSEHFNVDSHTIKKILLKNNEKWINKKHIQRLYRYINDGPLAQLDLNNNIVNIFESSSDANEYFGRKRESSMIKEACAGSRNTAYGYKWIYCKDVPEEIWRPYIKNEIEYYKNIRNIS